MPWLGRYFTSDNNPIKGQMKLVVSHLQHKYNMLASISWFSKVHVKFAHFVRSNSISTVFQLYTRDQLPYPSSWVSRQYYPIPCQKFTTSPLEAKVAGIFSSKECDSQTPSLYKTPLEWPRKTLHPLKTVGGHRNIKVKPHSKNESRQLTLCWQYEVLVNYSITQQQPEELELPARFLFPGSFLFIIRTRSLNIWNTHTMLKSTSCTQQCQNLTGCVMTYKDVTPVTELNEQSFPNYLFLSPRYYNLVHLSCLEMFSESLLFIKGYPGYIPN